LHCLINLQEALGLFYAPVEVPFLKRELLCEVLLLPNAVIASRGDLALNSLESIVECDLLPTKIF
jgi:hypothetical protein